MVLEGEEWDAMVGGAGPWCGHPSLRNGRKARGAQVGLSVPSENEMERAHHSVSGVLQSGTGLPFVSWQLATLAKCKRISVNLGFSHQ